VGETCNLAAPGRYGMVYLDRVETHWPLRMQLPVGTQVPFHCTASGKMYLSSLRIDKLKRVLSWLELEPSTVQSITTVDQLLEELAVTRSRGFSTDNQEFMDNMVAVAVPIRDTEGRLMTTLSIHAPRQRHDIESLTKLVPKVQEAAQRLEMLNRS
jgi:DNA-binding IclR family transcriptional regulator